MSPLTDALFLHLLLLSPSALTIGFTEPASLSRPSLLPVLILLVHRILPLCLPATNNVLLAALLASPSISFLFQYLDAALLSQWSFSAGGPTKGNGAVDQIPRKSKERGEEMPWGRGRLRFGIYAATSPLYIGTPFEAKGIPSFDAKDPTYIPSRATFLRQKAFVVLICYLVLDAMTFAARPELNQITYHPDRISMLEGENWSEERLGVRLGSTLGYWVCLYCVVQGYMGVAGLLTVGIGGSGVELWRPAFGRVEEAWTVRRFWGIFWHKFQQQKISSPARFVTNDVLRLTRGTLSSRYVHLFITFFVSGLIHALTDIGVGYTWEESGSIRFFCTQAFGIMLEDGVQALFGRVLPGFKETSAYQLFSKAAGYIWVFAFMVWSTPGWMYPALYANKGEQKEVIVPYSVVGAIYEMSKRLEAWKC